MKTHTNRGCAWLLQLSYNRIVTFLIKQLNVPKRFSRNVAALPQNTPLYHNSLFSNESTHNWVCFFSFLLLQLGALWKARLSGTLHCLGGGRHWINQHVGRSRAADRTSEHPTGSGWLHSTRCLREWNEHSLEPPPTFSFSNVYISVPLKWP